MLSACNTVILLCSTMCMKMLVTSCTQLSGYTRWMSVYIIIHTYSNYLFLCSFNITVLCILYTASLQELWWNILLWLFWQQSPVAQLSKASQSVWQLLPSCVGYVIEVAHISNHVLLYHNTYKPFHYTSETHTDA